MSEPTVQDLTAAADQAVADAQAATTPAQEPASTPEPPDWQVILDALPESLIPTVTPAIEQYHQNLTSRYTELEEQYKPWKDIGFDPDEARRMAEFAQQFDENPVGVYEALEQHLIQNGLLEEAQAVADEAAAAAGAPPVEPGDDSDLDPQVAALRQQLEIMAASQQQMMELFQQQQVQAQEDENQAALDSYLEELQASHNNELDLDYVVNLMAQGVDGDVAAKRWMDKVEGIRAGTTKPGDNAPVVMGGGGSLPSNRIPDVKSLDRNALNDLVVQRLQADAQAAGRG